MTDKTAQDWSNYWQGRAASEAGAALVGVGVETNQEIGAFWSERLQAVSISSRLLDLACGAGSVVRCAAALGIGDITGVDISREAIQTLKTEFPNVRGVVASADATGLPSGSFDVVASQFGFEYADPIKAAGEAARLLKPDGQFLALAHSRDSAIEAEVSALGGDAKAIRDSGFIAAASAMFRADMSGASDAVFDKTAQTFAAPQTEVLNIAKRSGGLAAHLYEGTQTLYQQRLRYNLSDIIGWLNGMESEINAFIGRMDSMQGAALSDVDVKAILRALEQGGLTAAQPEKFTSASTGDVLGWVIFAKGGAKPKT